MKVAVIGASGFVGKHVVNEALSRRHQVAAIVSNAEIKIRHENLSVIQGDFLDTTETSKFLSGCEAVISAYYPVKTTKIYDAYLNGSLGVLKAIKDAAVKRFLVIGEAGSLEIRPGIQLVDTSQFPTERKAEALAARDFFDILKNEHSLEWTYLSPAILVKSGKRTATFDIGSNQPVYDDKGESLISVEDLAVAVIDELEQPKHIRQRFTVGYTVNI
jgi:uncharacterized protein